MPVSLLCLVGLPGSGKTTLANTIKNYLQEIGCYALIVEYDSQIIYEDFHSRQGLWKESRQKLLAEVEIIAEQLQQNKSQNSLIILDDNFYYKSMRYEVYRIARKMMLGFCQIGLDTPYDLCCSRNSSREKPQPLDVMSRMKSVLELPDPTKNPWERYSITFTTTTPNRRDIEELVFTSWANPFRSKSEVSVLQVNSIVHYADLALRRIVKSKMDSVAADRRREANQFLSQRKKNLLEDIKTGNISLPQELSGPDSVPALVDHLVDYF